MEHPDEDRVADDRVAESRVADDRVAESRVAEDRIAEDRIAEDRVAEDRVAEDRVAEDRVAEDRVAEDRVAEDCVAEDRVAEDRVAEDRIAEDRIAIVNPERSALADELAEAGAVDDVTEPDRADDLPEVARDAVESGADVVAAVGGDGTQRTVAEAVAGTDTELVVVPGGTVNLLGRVLGIEDAADARGALEDGETRSLDLARCNGRSFLLNSSSGYDADVIERTDDRAKRFGRVGYGAVGLFELLRATPRSVTVTVDGEIVHDGDALTVLVFNVPVRGSTSFRIAPDAEPDDGRLDLIVIGPRRRSLVRFGLARARGRTPRDDDAVLAQGETITVEWQAPVAVQCDGDAVDHAASVEYTVEHRAVDVRTA